MTPSHSTVHTKLDLSDSASYLPSNLFQPRSTFFNRKQNSPGVQQLLLRRNRLDSLHIYEKALQQLKQHLTELSLRENNFTTFPIEVTVLQNLTSLSLANNHITSIEIDTISQLSNLQWLNLCNNKLKELPVDIVRCHHLRGLDLENNNFEKFPEVIFYLTRLEVLMIQRNKIQKLPDNYDFPPTIHTLNLAFNQFTQIPLTLINKPPAALTHIHFSGNRLRSLDPKFLSVGYEKLVSLDLHTCQLSRCAPKIFERLSKCKNLKRLNLAINRLSSLPSEIGLLSQLQWLNLNDNVLTELPESMSNLIHLVKLGLVQNRIEVLPPFIFLHMLELQKLDIRRNLLKYMPPSILALAPRQEVDIHVDLAVPHTVFHTLSNPTCPTTSSGQVMEQQCLDGHPYGGSLRTLLFYENATIEHVDGILCDLGDSSDETTTSPESVQALSMSSIYSILQSTAMSDNSKSALRQALIPESTNKNLIHCNHPRFRRSDNPMPNLLSEIDDDEEANAHEGDIGMNEEERDAIQTETHRILTSVSPLRELCLRSHLTKMHHSLLKKQQGMGCTRLDQAREKSIMFIKSVLPSNIIPTMVQLATIQQGRQCDYCADWYTDSKFQIGYLARLCNNRLQIPIRFNVCSVDCALDAVMALFQSTADWHTRQSLAHIDATLLLPTPVPSPQDQTRQPDTVHRGTVNHWNANLLRRGPTPPNASTRDGGSSPTDSTQSASSSNTTLSSVSTLSSRHSSLARTIRNRVSQFAATFFSGSGLSVGNETERQPDLSTSSSSSSTDTIALVTSQSSNSSSNTNQSQILPLVFPNLNLGTTSNVMDQPQNDPPAIMTITSRLVDGRLQTERTQPQLRLSTPTPSPTAFNHLPRDAIRLEKF